MTPTLCHCGRHKDRCRCAGSDWTLGLEAEWHAAKAEQFRLDQHQAASRHWFDSAANSKARADVHEEAAARLRAIANGAP